jgi:prophage regulatory protein
MPLIKKVHTPDAAARYWRLPAVLTYTQRSRSAIYADPTFPKPVKLGPSTSAWLASEVVDWCNALENLTRKGRA